MTTAIAIAIYCAFAIVRHRQDAKRGEEIKRIAKRMDAIEEALRNSPFITYRNN